MECKYSNDFGRVSCITKWSSTIRGLVPSNKILTNQVHVEKFTQLLEQAEVDGMFGDVDNGVGEVLNTMIKTYGDIDHATYYTQPLNKLNTFVFMLIFIVTPTFGGGIVMTDSVTIKSRFIETKLGMVGAMFTLLWWVVVFRNVTTIELRHRGV